MSWDAWHRNSTATESIKDYETLLVRLKENKQQLLALIDRFSNNELYGTPWYGKWTRGRMIQFNTALPYRNASGRLAKLKKQLDA